MYVLNLYENYENRIKGNKINKLEFHIEDVAMLEMNRSLDFGHSIELYINGVYKFCLDAVEMV